MSSIVKRAIMHRIHVDDLKVGMNILSCDKAWLKLPFFGGSVKSINDITTLKNYGVRYVFIKKEDVEIDNFGESEGELDTKSINDTLLREAKQRDVGEFAPTIEEVEYLQRIHGFAQKATKNMFLDVRSGKTADSETAKFIVNSFVDSCFKKPALIASLTRLKSFDDYTFTHSINVSVLNISLGKKLGMDSDELKIIGLGGLFHDIGKMMIPDNVLNKPGKLTDSEYELIKKHVEYGYDIVKQYKWFPEAAYKCVLQHHERSDGAGYPEGLKDHEITKYGKISAIVDVYDAITSDRIYHKGMIPSKAMKLLFGWSGTHFNKILVKFFVDILGIYPVGTLVLLDTGELAIVFETNKKDPTRPVVMVITDCEKRKCEPYLFDLESYNVVTNIAYKSIICPLNDKKYGINTNETIDRFLTSSYFEV